VAEVWHRTASPEFERMNANGLLGLHGDDLRIAAELEGIGKRTEPPPHEIEDHELHSPARHCARCRRTFTTAEAARRRIDGQWVHQFCAPAEKIRLAAVDPASK
jgi:hypothetical protein